MIEHIITHVLVMLKDDLGGSSADDYLLKVFGFSEYLIKYVFENGLQLVEWVWRLATLLAL